MAKQVIVLRKDLNMRKGKMCAQAAHASMAVFFNNMIDNCKTYVGLNGEIIKSNEYILPVDDSQKEWIEGLFTKIVVGCDSKEELLNLMDKANSMDIPNALIEDNGLTEFNGKRTITALAIGPAEEEDIDIITSELQLL